MKPRANHKTGNHGGGGEVKIEPENIEKTLKYVIVFSV